MPIHDWTRVDARLFQSFHLSWICALSDSLNNGGLPGSHYAMIERKELPPLYDFADLGPPPKLDPHDEKANAAVVVSVAAEPPPGRILRLTSEYGYAAAANRITIRGVESEVVAVIEILVPGNKATTSALRSFVDRAASFLRHGIHLLVIDLFPPTRHAPFGIHAAIWQEFATEDTAEIAPPKERPRMLAAYSAGQELTAYIETRNVGDPLTDMPVFLRPEEYVRVPLEATYQKAWSNFPGVLKRRVDTWE
ncbi:MAG TPA: DUF4058 family protein [Pirellulales bacterium]|nr:DUF4058 family protein [Pirellulales bacterium]